MQIYGETVSGSGTSWKLLYPQVSNTQQLYAGGTRLNPGIGNDYTIDASGNITTVASYTSGSLICDYLTGTTQVTQSGADILSPYALTTLQRVKDILFDPNRYISLTGASLTSGSNDVTGLSVPTGAKIFVGQTITGTGIPYGTTITAIISSTEIYLSNNATASNTGQTLLVVDQPTAYDGMLIRYINAATDYINNFCGRRSFVQKTYVNDMYSISTPRQSYLRLRDFPVFPYNQDDPIHIQSFQWRAGTPSNPGWVDFIPDQYELVDPQTEPTSGLVFYPSGIIRVYGVLPRLYNNMIRATYSAGYPVNWGDAEDRNLHWLPADISNVCENFAVRRFKRRQLAGQLSQALEGATSSWNKEMDQDDQDILGQYRNISF